MADQDKNPDTRRFSTTFKKPTRVRFRNAGTVYFDEVLEGEVEIFLRDTKVPFSGLTEVLLGDSETAFASFNCR